MGGRLDDGSPAGLLNEVSPSDANRYQDMEESTTVRDVRPERSGLLIEAASLEDVHAILRIEQASFSAPWTRNMIEAELHGNPFASFLLARKSVGGEILGYVCYWVVFEELRIMNLAVDLSARRQGLAMELVHHALKEGHAGGARRAVLEVRISNQPALHLYRTFGFRQVAVRAGYYTQPIEDAVLMELHPVPG